MESNMISEITVSLLVMLVWSAFILGARGT